MSFRAPIWSYAGVTGAFCAFVVTLGVRAALLGGLTGFLGSLVAGVALERKQ